MIEKWRHQVNRYPLDIFWSAEDKGFIAEAPDLPDCSAWGETEVEAAREAQDAIAAWLQAAKAAIGGTDLLRQAKRTK
jgi:predicted RNase H-like HicB family nuclease